MAQAAVECVGFGFHGIRGVNIQNECRPVQEKEQLPDKDMERKVDQRSEGRVEQYEKGGHTELGGLEWGGKLMNRRY